MYEEDLSRPVPHESTILVEADAIPEERRLVIAYIPERDLGVIKQFRRDNENVVLKSYRVGSPMFWAREYLEMRIVGVVRRISYEP